jgi:queuine tRNA-ribosyltransferase
MGVGTPQDLVRAVRAGIDMFDCVMPTRHARNGQLFTTCGRLNVANARHRTNERPPDPSCRCATCQRFSMAYLSHLYRRKQMLYHQLATIHNLHHYFSLMRDLRQAIVAGTLNDQFGAVG